MVKASHNKPRVADIINEKASSSSSNTKKYKGVRKRNWGKYVSEIRLPKSRDRIWLGSYDTAEKAARAFDAAQYCLRGGAARFNFPDDPPLIENGRSMPRSEIKVAAARFAHSAEVPGRVASVDAGSDQSVPLEASAGLLLNHEESPTTCAFISTGPVQRLELDCVIPEMPLGKAFFDPLGDATDLGLFPEFNEYAGDYIMVPPDNHWQDYDYNYNYEEINADDGSYGYLWDSEL